MKDISEKRIFSSRLTAKHGLDSWLRSGTLFGLCCEERSASRAHLDCCWRLGSVFHLELFERSREMRMFSEKEVDYIKSQRLARIGTVSKELQPDVAAVGFEFDGQNFYIGGIRQTKTYKYKNVANGTSRVALVIDD